MNRYTRVGNVFAFIVTLCLSAAAAGSGHDFLAGEGQSSGKHSSRND